MVLVLAHGMVSISSFLFLSFYLKPFEDSSIRISDYCVRVSLHEEPIFIIMILLRPIV